MFIVVQINRIVDENFPIFVAFEFVDAMQRKHQFVEKFPVISNVDIEADQLTFPRVGHVACTIEREFKDDTGHRLVEVNTEIPWGIASLEGKTNFLIHSSNLERV